MFERQQKADHLNIDWRNFYKSVFTLVFPMALQNLINVGITAVDVFMLGMVGEKALSGVSLAGQIQFIMTLFFFGITSGSTVLTAQYWGKRDTKTIEKILSMSLAIAAALSSLFAALAICVPDILMKIFTSDVEVIREGADYLRIVGVSYLFMAVTQVYLNIMRSIERVLIATLVYAMSLIVNIVVNAILIFGLFGFPALGAKGAAIGTLCSRITEVLAVLLYAKLKNKTVKMSLNYMIHIDRVLFKDYLAYALPVVINELFWGLGYSTNAAIIGHLGSAVVAANSVAQVARQLATVVAFGVSSATAIYLGKTIGEKRIDHARAYAKRFLFLSFVVGMCGAIFILSSSPIIKANMALSGQAKAYLGFMFIVMSYYTLSQSMNTTTIVGILRSGGDTKYALIADLASMWGFSIIVGVIAAFVFHADVRVVYVILMSDEVLKIPIAYQRYKSYKWLKDVTREQ